MKKIPLKPSVKHRSSVQVVSHADLTLATGEKVEAVVKADSVIFKARRRAISPLLSIIKLTDNMTKPSRAATVTKENKGVAALNLYDAFFPRDAHIVAYFLRDKYPELTKLTVLECLRYTGVKENLHGHGLKDEQEAGKVPHEIRDGVHDPIALQLSTTKDWGWPYYGAIDTTGKNINAIAYLVSQPGGFELLHKTYTGLDGQTHIVEDGFHAHINWVRKRMDMNPDGLMEALWINPKHHANQTWADSTDAFHHADGSWPTHYADRSLGVASVELQAETYDALMNAADIYKLILKGASTRRRVHLQNEIDDLVARAEKLKRTVLKDFWIEDKVHYGGFFARGTDHDKGGHLCPLAIRSSDMGHLLNSRILDGTEPEVIAKRDAVIKNLFSPEMICPNGIRTLSSDSCRYYKDKYHNGTSWPWVTYYIALGLKRHGYYGLAQELEERILSLYETTKILPEYGSGSSNPAERLVTTKVIVSDPSAAEKTYTITQPAQEVQAWTAAAVLAIKNERNQSAVKERLPASPSVTDKSKRRFEVQILNNLA